MDAFTRFLLLFLPGMVLQLGSLAALLLLRRHGALPYALCGAALIAGAAAVDRDYTLLTGQLPSAWILWRMLRKNPEIPTETSTAGSKIQKRKAPGQGGGSTIMPNKRTTSQHL